MSATKLAAERHAALVERLTNVVSREPYEWAASLSEDIAELAGDALFAKPEDANLATRTTGALKAIADLAKIARILAEHQDLEAHRASESEAP